MADDFNFIAETFIGVIDRDKEIACLKVKCAELQKQIDAHGSESWIEIQKTVGVKQRRIDELEQELNRFKEGQISVEEAHHMCHNLEKTVSAEAFCAGCHEYQKKLFGRSPDEETIKRLKSAIWAHLEGHVKTPKEFKDLIDLGLL